MTIKFLQTKEMEGIQFTTRYWLQGKILIFIKELDYSIEKVRGFDQLEQYTKDELLEWKEITLKGLKSKLSSCYEEIITDMASEDSHISSIKDRSE